MVLSVLPPPPLHHLLARVAKSLQLRTFPQFLDFFLEGDRRSAPPFVNNLEALGSRTCNTFQTSVQSAPGHGAVFPGSLLGRPVLSCTSGVLEPPSSLLLTVGYPLTHLRNPAAVGNSWHPLTV